MRRPPADIRAAVDAAARRDLGADEHVVASVVGVAHALRPWSLGRAPLPRTPRGLVVTDRRLLVIGPHLGEGFALAADCPRYAVAVTAYRAADDGRAALLILELAGKPLALHVSASERARAAAVVLTLGGLHPGPGDAIAANGDLEDAFAGPDERFVASLGPVDLTRRSRRALGIRMHERASVVVTDRHVVFLARRGAHTRVATRYPRQAVRVIDHETVWPGGELIFDRVAVKAGDATVRFDLDGRMHERANAVVAALGGMHAG
jgi:hypothetical protein